MDFKAKILVIDDERRYRELIKVNLQADGYEVVLADDGLAGLDAYLRHLPALVILDVRMPGLNGFAVCQRLREFSDVPVVFTTVQGMEMDLVRGLEAGATDYMVKPFSVQELCARVRAILRRRGIDRPGDGSHLFRHGDLVVDLAHASVTVRGRPVALTATEYKLLLLFIQNLDTVIPTCQLARTVWGDGYSDSKEVVWVSLSRLRQKLGDDSRQPRLILTRPGVGYVMPSP